MAVFKSQDNNELIITCKCGCEEAIHIIVNDDDKEFGHYAFMSYMNGDFYRHQEDSMLNVVKRKLKKIWAIIANQDYYYSDIRMDTDDFNQLKEYINQF